MNETGTCFVSWIYAEWMKRTPADSEGYWTADRVEGLAKLVPDIGDKVGETYDWVELATTLDVSIRNERALRYEVGPEIWDSGLTIDDWVSRIMETLQ